MFFYIITNFQCTKTRISVVSAVRWCAMCSRRNGTRPLPARAQRRRSRQGRRTTFARSISNRVLSQLLTLAQSALQPHSCDSHRRFKWAFSIKIGLHCLVILKTKIGRQLLSYIILNSISYIAIIWYILSPMEFILRAEHLFTDFHWITIL